MFQGYAKWAIAIAALCLRLSAQVPVQPAPDAKTVFVNPNTGVACAGCKLYTYAAGTTTPIATYVDSTGTSVNTNPVILDASGAGNIWLAALAYKFILKDPNNSTIWTVDNLPGNQFLNGITLTAALTGTGFTFSGSGTVAGAITAGAVNGEVNGALASPAAVSAPVIQPLVFPTATGGSAAANTYACKVTFNGATAGETTPSVSSPLSVVSGSTNVLTCAAADAPAGALTYNTYWQTGGSGNFFLGHTGTAMDQVDYQTTTPATSGTQPPVSNTATGILAGGQAQLAGGAGVMRVPASVTSAGGSPGDPALSQTIFDYRTGGILQRMTKGSPQKSMTGSVMDYGHYIDMVLPTLNNGQQVNAFGSSIEQGDPYGSVPYGGSLQPIPATAAGFFRNYRFGTNANAIWGINPYAWIGNQNAIAYAGEFICNNSSGSDAASDVGCTAIHILNGGANYAYSGMAMDKNYTNGIYIDGAKSFGILINSGAPVGIQSGSPYYSANPAAATVSVSAYAPKFNWQSHIWHAGASIQDQYIIQPFGGNGLDAFTGLQFTHTAGGSGSSIFQFDTGIVTILPNSNPGMRITPPADDTLVAFEVTNHAGASAVAYIDDSGTIYNAQGVQIPANRGASASGIAVLTAGVSATISNSAACTASATCIYKALNVGINASTATGCYGITNVSVGVSFKITAFTCGAVTTQTGDVSTLSWQIN